MATVVVVEVGTVGVLVVKTMGTEGLQGARHIEVVVVIILLRPGVPRRHIEVVVITLLGAHLMVGDQEGTGLGLPLHIPLTGVLKGTMLVVR